MTFKEKMKSFFQRFKIRMQLLFLWFLKNVMVFVKVAIIVLVILIACGIFTPADGGLLSLIFKDVVENTEALKTGEKVTSAILAIVISAFFLLYRTRAISITDIKSRSLKIAMIKANLYFNENGKLCRKLEETTKIDLNGDGKIGEENLKDVPNEITVKGVARAAGELVTILTAPIDPDAGGEKVMEAAQLTDPFKEPTEEEKKLDEEMGIVEISDKLYSEEQGAPSLVKEEENKYSGDEYNMDKELDKPCFIIRFFRNLLITLHLIRNPKLIDGMDEHHHHHHNEKPVEEHIEEEIKETVEVVNTEEQPADLIDLPEVPVETKADNVTINVTINQQNTTTTNNVSIDNLLNITKNENKTKDVNDILNSLK